MPPTLRLATSADVPVLNDLIPASARELSRGFYTPAEAEAAIRYVFGVNHQLIADGTYFVIEDAGAVVACGGWSFRNTLYGGDQRPVGADAPPDQVAPAAKIRAFFVAPGQARKGLGGLLMDACVAAAAAAGFERLELMSTLPGVPFYHKLGFRDIEAVQDRLPDGTVLGFVRMERAIGT
ncbi:MAG: GNAT family N-acetyltransferase [Gemmatimonadales bacterium]